jgi:hypothetical protein
MEKPYGDNKRSANGDRRQRRNLALEFEFRHSSLKAGLQFVGALAGLPRIDFGIGLAGQFLVLELVGAMIPVGDFFGQPVLDRRHGPCHQVLAAIPNFTEVYRNKIANRVANDHRLQVAL